MTAGALAGLACAAGGVWVLRTAWCAKVGGWRLLAGWALLAAGVIGWRLTGAGWDWAAGLAVLCPCLAGFAAVLAGAEPPRRQGARMRPKPERRPERQDVEPPLAQGAAWRGWARAACVGPLAGLGAVGCGALIALRAPWEAADRLVAGGFLAPVVWAAAAVWATTDERLGRVAVGLALLSVASFGAAAL